MNVNGNNVIFIDRYIKTFRIDPKGIKKKEDTLETMVHTWASSYANELCEKIIERVNYHSPRISEDTPICLSQKVRRRTVNTLQIYGIDIEKLVAKRMRGIPQLRSVETKVSIAETHNGFKLYVTVQLV